jgi:hypothetical protein
MKSVTRSASHSLTSSTITDGPSGIPTSVESSRTMSIQSDSVFNLLQRGYTILKQILGMLVGTAASGTAMFIIIFVLH